METVGHLVRRKWGQNVRRYRQQAELTQGQMAERLGVDQSTVSRIETGDLGVINPELVLRIAVVLGTDPEYIFEWPPGIRELAAIRGAG